MDEQTTASHQEKKAIAEEEEEVAAKTRQCAMATRLKCDRGLWLVLQCGVTPRADVEWCAFILLVAAYPHIVYYHILFLLTPQVRL